LRRKAGTGSAIIQAITKIKMNNTRSQKEKPSEQLFWLYSTRKPVCAERGGAQFGHSQPIGRQARWAGAEWALVLT